MRACFRWWHQVVRNLFSFPHHNPHGIKDSRIRDFIQRARASRGSAEAGHPVTPGGAVFEHRQLVNAVCKLVPYVRQPSLIVHPLEDDYAARSRTPRICATNCPARSIWSCSTTAITS